MRDVENEGDSGGRRKNIPGRQKSVGSVDVDPACLENRKEAEKAQGVQGLNVRCRESMFILSRLVRGFCNKTDSGLGRSMQVA